MDVPLYAIALVAFSLLYLGLGVFLGYALVMSLVIMFLYLAVRYGNVAENYPYGVNDSMITIIFIGVTWGIFAFLGPKNPVPFLPTGGTAGFTYSTSTVLPIGALIAITFVLIFAFLAIGAFIAHYLGSGGGGGGGGGPGGLGGESKPKQGVGAG